jgi:DNA-binding GntR family transcriptional regulator
MTIFETLRDEILTLELKPGQLIDEASLAERFAVSRSPVREALVRLGSEGLVKTLPNKGTVVAPLNIEEFPQYIDALDLIQRAVTRLAAELHDEDELARIKAAQEAFRDCVENKDVLGMIAKNRDLHLEISAAGKNRILTDTYRRILDEGRRMLRLYFRSYGDMLPPELCDAHDKMIAAIGKRDLDLAERLAHEHAEEVHARFIHYLSQRKIRDFAVAP